jgi:hypothetical protein
MKILSQSITSQQLLDLRDTPVKIIDAPGSGYMSLPFLILMRLHAGNTPYGTLTTSFGLIANGVNLFPNQTLSTAFLGSATDKFLYYVFTHDDLSAGIDVSDLENQDVYLKNTGLLELTAGNGTLDVEVYWNTFSV